MTTTTPDGPTVLPRGLLILLGLGAATIAVAGMRTLSGIIGPAFLAIVLTIGVHPARVWVRRRGWPEWLGTIVAMVLVYAVLLALCLSLVVSGARLADLLPAYEDDVRDLVGDVQGWFEGLGVGEAEAEELMSGFDLGKLTDPSRGPLLVRVGPERRYRYRFQKPFIRPYILMRAINDGLLVPETS